MSRTIAQEIVLTEAATAIINHLFDYGSHKVNLHSNYSQLDCSLYDAKYEFNKMNKERRAKFVSDFINYVDDTLGTWLNKGLIWA